MAFADNLKTLPSITHLAGLRLIDANGQVAATIENKPGKAGSVAVSILTTPRAASSISRR